MIQTPDTLIRPEVELIGRDGNAFAILGACTKALRRAGNSRDVIAAFQQEATSGDYNHVLATALAYCEVRWMSANAPTLRIHMGFAHNADDYVYTALCSMPDTPRGEYDEEIDIIATGRRPGETAIRRLVSEELARNYEPGLKVRKIVRVW